MDRYSLCEQLHQSPRLVALSATIRRAVWMSHCTWLCDTHLFIQRLNRTLRHSMVTSHTRQLRTLYSGWGVGWPGSRGPTEYSCPATRLLSAVGESFRWTELTMRQDCNQSSQRHSAWISVFNERPFSHPDNPISGSTDNRVASGPGHRSNQSHETSQQTVEPAVVGLNNADKYCDVS